MTIKYNATPHHEHSCYTHTPLEIPAGQGDIPVPQVFTQVFRTGRCPCDTGVQDRMMSLCHRCSHRCSGQDDVPVPQVFRTERCPCATGVHTGVQDRTMSLCHRCSGQNDVPVPQMFTQVFRTGRCPCATGVHT
ncbi:hypothetical protein ACOMHN_020638 [Nucella lapillus]